MVTAVYDDCIIFHFSKSIHADYASMALRNEGLS